MYFNLYILVIGFSILKYLSSWMVRVFFLYFCFLEVIGKLRFEIKMFFLRLLFVLL